MRKSAGPIFAVYPNLDVEYFLCTPVSFPVPAFWWKLTISLEHSLPKNQKKKEISIAKSTPKFSKKSRKKISYKR